MIVKLAYASIADDVFVCQELLPGGREKYIVDIAQNLDVNLKMPTRASGGTAGLTSTMTNLPQGNLWGAPWVDFLPSAKARQKRDLHRAQMMTWQRKMIFLKLSHFYP